MYIPKTYTVKVSNIKEYKYVLRKSFDIAGKPSGYLDWLNFTKNFHYKENECICRTGDFVGHAQEDWFRRHAGYGNIYTFKEFLLLTIRPIDLINKSLDKLEQKYK